MAGYIGTKAALLSTTTASVGGDSTVGGDLTVDTDTLYVDSTNNRVGIGTSSPQDALHIAKASAVLRLEDTDTNHISTIQSGGSGLIITADAANTEASSYMAFNVDNSEAMRIDASGRVGIGDVPKASFTSHSILQVGGQAILGANDALSSTGQTYLTHNIYYDTSGTPQVFNTSNANEGTVYTQADGIHKWSNSAATTGTPSVQERMRIDSSGNLLVGTTSVFDGAYTLQVQVTGSTGGIIIEPQADNYTAMRFNNSSGTQVGDIVGGASSTSYNTSSDHRLKENVVAMTGATDRLKQLNPSRFNFIADADTTVDGFLAHEVQAVVPEAITGTKDAVDDDGNPVYQGIDQSKLVPLLTAALQEALTKIDALETRITALEAV